MKAVQLIEPDRIGAGRDAARQQFEQGMKRVVDTLGAAGVVAGLLASKLPAGDSSVAYDAFSLAEKLIRANAALSSLGLSEQADKVRMIFETAQQGLARPYTTGGDDLRKAGEALRTLEVSLQARE